MQNVTDVGFIIHSRPYHENSRLLELFTLVHGRVSAVARLSKGKSASGSAVLQPFVPLSFSWFSSANLVTLSDYHQTHREFSMQVPYIFSALYANELLYFLYKDRETPITLFSAYAALLETLADRADPTVRLREYELELLASLGVALRLPTREDDIDAQAWYVFSTERGFYRCSQTNDCFPERYRGAELQAAVSLGYRSPLVKKITQQVLNELLQGRKLHSRQMYLDFLRYGV